MILRSWARGVTLAAICTFSLSSGVILAKKDNHPTPLPTYQYPTAYNHYLQPLATAIDYHSGMIYLFNYENDKLIIVDPTSLSGWPGDIPLQHTLLLPEGNKFLLHLIIRQNILLT